MNGKQQSKSIGVLLSPVRLRAIPPKPSCARTGLFGQVHAVCINNYSAGPDNSATKRPKVPPFTIQINKFCAASVDCNNLATSFVICKGSQLRSLPFHTARLLVQDCLIKGSRSGFQPNAEENVSTGFHASHVSTHLDEEDLPCYIS